MNNLTCQWEIWACFFAPQSDRITYWIWHIVNRKQIFLLCTEEDCSTVTEAVFSNISMYMEDAWDRLQIYKGSVAL